MKHRIQTIGVVVSIALVAVLAGCSAGEASIDAVVGVAAPNNNTILQVAEAPVGQAPDVAPQVQPAAVENAPQAPSDEGVAVQPAIQTTGANTACAADLFMAVTAHPANAGLPTPALSASCDGTTVTVTSNSIPNHSVGDFPNSGNPNTISAQNEFFTFAQNPTIAASVTYTQGMAFGVAINGVEFDPGTAERDPESGWNIEALGGLNLGLDHNDAHVQPTGAYHYHSVPHELVDLLGDGTQMTLVGFAADGFPVYSEMGYSDPMDANSAVVELVSSWQVKSGQRPTGTDGPGGTYDGFYTQDWEFVAGSGDLDQCNGRTGVTPEYPDGTYYYVLTNQFPYIPRCHVGTADASFGFGGGGGQAGQPPTGGNDAGLPQPPPGGATGGQLPPPPGGGRRP